MRLSLGWIKGWLSLSKSGVGSGSGGRAERKEVTRKVRLCAEQGTWDLERVERPGDKVFGEGRRQWRAERPGCWVEVRGEPGRETPEEGFLGASQDSNDVSSRPS